ncbi:MAG: thioredoxin domain-containing protein [Gemmatimonadota bacterium]
MRLTSILVVGALAIVAAIAMPALVARGSVARPDTVDFLLPQRSKGAENAPVTVYEMSDFQCPYCRRHALETFPELEREYVTTGKVRWVFINFPIPELHPNATAAAEFAMCAARLDRFWPVHDLLFRNQEHWERLSDPGPYLLGLADSAHIARSAILSCLTNHETRDLVRSDAEGAARAGVRSTPSFIIEGGLLRGAAPASDFKPILDSIYQLKTGGNGR